MKKKNLKSNTMQKAILCLVLAIMMMVFSIASPYFLKIDNLMTIALQTAITGITACGMTYVLISAANDLSLGSNIAFTSVICAMLIQVHFNMALAIVLTIVAGTMVGILNAHMVANMKMPPFIATLGMQMALRGLALTITDAKPIYVEIPVFRKIAQYRLFNVIPLPVIYMIILAMVASFVLRKTVIGRNIYAVGSNEEAARLSGINIIKVRVFAYMFCGALAAVAGIIMTSRVNSGQPAIAAGYEANAIAASVIGGTAMRGGRGTIGGSILGAFILGVLMNGLNLMNVSQYLQMFATGIVVILAVYFDRLRTRKSAV